MLSCPSIVTRQRVLVQNQAACSEISVPLGDFSRDPQEHFKGNLQETTQLKPCTHKTGAYLGDVLGCFFEILAVRNVRLGQELVNQTNANVVAPEE